MKTRVLVFAACSSAPRNGHMSLDENVPERLNAAEWGDIIRSVGTRRPSKRPEHLSNGSPMSAQRR